MWTISFTLLSKVERSSEKLPSIITYYKFIHCASCKKDFCNILLLFFFSFIRCSSYFFSLTHRQSRLSLNLCCILRRVVIFFASIFQFLPYFFLVHPLNCELNSYDLLKHSSFYCSIILSCSFLAAYTSRSHVIFHKFWFVFYVGISHLAFSRDSLQFQRFLSIFCELFWKQCGASVIALCEDKKNKQQRTQQQI